ncbi:hypothetical protein BHM03_00056753, partial [Ensete ventricosum]
QGAATPAANAVAPAGGRADHGLQPLVGALQPAPFAGVVLQAVVPAGGAGLPFGLALTTASRPLVGGLGRGLTVGGRPCMGSWPWLATPPRCLRYKNATRMRRTILRDSISCQASSPLAVSIRWISSVKLLQSDLATLAQREGGE